MTDSKSKRDPPKVEVIRRPGAAPTETSPSAPAPRPVAPRPATAAVGPRPVSPAAPRPAGAASGPRPDGHGPKGKPGGKPSFRSGPPRPPPTPEQVQELAKRDHVPARIAKGDLEGKMKTRIWRKLHAEEAKRFDQVYALMDTHPGLDLADGFGAVQSGLTVEEFLARKARTQKKAAVKQARGSVPGEVINGFIEGLIRDQTELAIVLGERTLLDALVSVEPVAFTLARQGRLEKLQVVLLARRTEWDAISPTLERDPKLTQKPLPIARQPEKRPVSDPRPFQEHLGEPVRLFLRNGLELSRPLRAFGPFDLIVGDEGEELFVPLHAVARFELDS